MLARPGTLPEDADGAWAYEIKWDGVRAIAYSTPGRAAPGEPQPDRDHRRATQSSAGWTGRSARTARSSTARSSPSTAHGRPSFAALQQRMHVGAQRRRRNGTRRDTPVTYMIFDLLWLDGHSLMDLPYCERRERLAALALSGESWQTPEHVVGSGSARAGGERRAGSRGDRRQASGLDLSARAALPRLGEGQARRSPGARDRRLAARQGATHGAHRRAAPRRLRRTARCATSGASAAGSATPSSTVSAACSSRCERSASPFTAGERPPRDAIFCEPRLVAEIEFTEWTTGGQRAPSDLQGPTRGQVRRGGRARGHLLAGDIERAR